MSGAGAGESPATAAAVMGGSAAGATNVYGTIVIVGGGCYGSYYLRQLGRARAAGKLTVARIVVVDRDADCRAALELRAAAEIRASAAVPVDLDSAIAGGPPHREGGSEAPAEPHRFDAVDIVIAPWDEFFASYLASAAADPLASAHDAIVPSPLMPHLMPQWLIARARARWPGRDVRVLPLDVAPPMPWQRAGDGGTHYVSFAEWMCPINCIEPARCPETRGPRSWSMPTAVHDYVEHERLAGRPLDGPAIFHCVHRAYGVGMFDTAEVLAADRLIAESGTRSAARVLVGTMSHCHGALDLIAIGPLAG